MSKIVIHIVADTLIDTRSLLLKSSSNHAKKRIEKNPLFFFLYAQKQFLGKLSLSMLDVDALLFFYFKVDQPKGFR